MRHRLTARKKLLASFSYSRLKNKILNENKYIVSDARRDYGYKRGADFSIHHLFNGEHVIPSSDSEKDDNQKEKKSKLLLNALKYEKMSLEEKLEYQQLYSSDYIQLLKDTLDKYHNELKHVVFIPTVFHNHLTSKNAGPWAYTQEGLKKKYDAFITAADVLKEIEGYDKNFKGYIDAIKRMRKTLRCIGVSENELIDIIKLSYNQLVKKIKEFGEP